MFSVEEMFDQLWSSTAPPDNGGADDDNLSKLNRSASEWAFQRFLEEGSPYSPSPSPTPPPPPHPFSSSSSTAHHHDQNDVEEIKMVNAHHYNPTHTHYNNMRPPNVTVDSDEYQAFLKTKLDLACAAVAMSREVRPFSPSGYFILMVSFSGSLCFSEKIWSKSDQWVGNELNFCLVAEKVVWLLRKLKETKIEF